MSLHRACCCVEDCSHCASDPTPATFQVVFSSLTASGCQGDPEGGSPDATGGCYLWLSQNATLTLPGTVCLQQIVNDPCCWCCVIPCEVDLYEEEECGGDVLCTSTENVYISLCIFSVGGVLKASLFAATLSDNSFCRRAGYFNNNDFSLALFSDTVDVTTPCSTATNFTNEVTSAGISNIAYGGTAVATPMACSPTSADCEMGDAADECAANCASCDSSLTIVVSGCGSPLDGTYSVTRSGCEWSGTSGGGQPASIGCGGGYWYVTVGNGAGSPGQTFVSDAPDACPEDVTTWIPCPSNPDFSTCTGGSITVS